MLLASVGVYGAMAYSVVGEGTNKLVGYLGVASRHLDSPLAVMVQSSSAAGKSSLMEAVLAFVPEEQRVRGPEHGVV